MIRYVMMMSQKSAVYLSGTIYNTAVFFEVSSAPQGLMGLTRLRVTLEALPPRGAGSAECPKRTRGE